MINWDQATASLFPPIPTNTHQSNVLDRGGLRSVRCCHPVVESLLVCNGSGVQRAGRVPQELLVVVVLRERLVYSEEEVYKTSSRSTGKQAQVKVKVVVGGQEL